MDWGDDEFIEGLREIREDLRTLERETLAALRRLLDERRRLQREAEERNGWLDLDYAAPRDEALRRALIEPYVAPLLDDDVRRALYEPIAARDFGRVPYELMLPLPVPKPQAPVVPGEEPREEPDLPIPVPKPLDPRASAAGVEAAPPDYRRLTVTQEQWDRFNNAVAGMPGVTASEMFAYSESFAAEGGIALDNSKSRARPTSSGIAAGTLDNAKAAGVPGLEGIERPGDLSYEQRAAIYRWYFDQALREVGGAAALDAIGDRYTTAAVADALFEHGTSHLIQRSINDVIRELPGAERKRLGVSVVPDDGHFGPTTLAALKALVGGGYGSTFRDWLAQRRDVATQYGEQARMEHFRFVGQP